MAVLSSRKQASLYKHVFSLLFNQISALSSLNSYSMLVAGSKFVLFNQNFASQVRFTDKGFL